MAEIVSLDKDIIRKNIFIKGVVQGVGFRPFIYKLALNNSLYGFVKNDSVGVEIEVEGSLSNIDLFEKQLISNLPPIAKIDSIKSKNINTIDEKSFKILQTSNDKTKTALISPDIATCKDCIDDIKNIEKYHNYYATNCTNCGPRYSILKSVPYDRANTSMEKFIMCKSCQDEYENPLNRRYHAQPISCINCGPKLSESIEKAAEFIKSGKIVAIKGIGGFHIVCDATNSEVVTKLRKYKNRPTKPFAIMCKNIEDIKSFAYVDKKEEELLSSKEAPIVILRKSSQKTSISNQIAPNIDKIGCILPYTPLHHILFGFIDKPIVATSANLGAEPIIIKKEDITKKLPFIDFILDNERDIVNGIDDSLVQIIDGKTQTLRLARGYSPKVIKLPFKSDKKILAVGANAKNSIAIVIEDNLILSPYIGDLDSIESFDFFLRTIESFKRFYDFKPDIIIYDKHPNYKTTIWAKEQNIKLVDVGHHIAHIYATKAEFGLSGDYLGFAFDGTGYGEDGTLWGGEVFVGDKRKYHFKPIKLLGADKAVKEPRRVALSMLFDKYTMDEIKDFDLELLKSFSLVELKILYQSYLKNINAPLSSSVGRMFDGVASFANLLQYQTYEGEAGLLCEQNYNPNIKRVFEYKIVDGVIDIEFDFFTKDIVSVFINTLVKIVVDISKIQKMQIILSGGVFQNKILLECLLSKFKEENIIYYTQNSTPINDGSIALGQVYYSLNIT